jgi:hypothetical protein
MNRKASPSHQLRRRVPPLVLLCALCVSVFAQTPGNSPPPAVRPAQEANDERAEQIVRRALEAQGGSAYLAVKTIIGRGYYSQFDKGMSLPPQTFVDYLVFPDRERTEFRGARGRAIQTNDGDRGWLYESSTRSLTDMKPEQVADFRLAMRNEAVRVTYPDGFTVDYEVGARDFLPAKTMYKRKNAEGEELAEEDRFASYKTINGLTVPFVIDHYRAGQQSSRINYDSVEFNTPVPDALFAKPASVKAIK